MPATDFHINGPTSVVIVHPSIQGGSVTLGYTDNDDLIRVEMTDHRQVFTRNDGGDMITQALHLGTSATIDMTLASWDNGALSTMMQVTGLGNLAGIPPTSAQQGRTATVGGLLVPQTDRSGTIIGSPEDRTIGLVIEPLNVGSVGPPAVTGPMRYTFTRLMLQTGPRFMDLGNATKRLAFSCITVFGSSGDPEVASNGMIVTEKLPNP